MARTPLLCILQKLYRDFAEAEASRRSVDEIQRPPIRGRAGRVAEIS